MTTGTHSHGQHVFAEHEAEVRQLYPSPSEISVQKSLTHLDAHCRHFISLSPFLCLATSHPKGPADVSPRGDAPGFVRVLDPVTLFIPDRLGNNRLDSLTNVVLNPQLALIFLVPGLDETLRVNGRGQVVIGGDLLAQTAVNGKVPRSGLLVTVQEAFLQCAKALKRSRLWSDHFRIEPGTFPSLGQVLADQIEGTSAQELDCRIEEAYRERLY